MAKEEKVEIKMELYRDESSKQLMIKLRFSSKASNISKDNGYYYWSPTDDERNFINDAFALIEGKAGSIPQVKPVKEPEKEEKPSDYDQPKVEIKNATESSNELDSDSIKVSDGSESEDVFAHKNPEIEGQSEQEQVDVEDVVVEDEEEEDVLVNADDSAIEEAVKKHVDEDDDKSIVQADEKMIIEKVLSQKKKGKWAKKK